jgi:hypothetical protein
MANFRTITQRGASIALILAMTGCNWIGRQADALGSHMPVIGERCEHWQCITKSGRQTSEMYKQQQMEQAEAAQKDAEQPTAATGIKTPAYPSQPAYHGQ